MILQLRLMSGSGVVVPPHKPDSSASPLNWRVVKFMKSAFLKKL